VRKRLGIIVAACLYYSGLVALSRWVMRRQGPKLIILNYHRASGGDLYRHMHYLRRHYRMLPLEEALQELYAPGRERKSDTRTSLVLTFDDGYYDNYTHAFPIAKKLRAPITIFLVPGYTESGDYFWWGEGHRLVRRATVAAVELDGKQYVLKDDRDAEQLAYKIDERLRHAPSVAEREAFLQEMRTQLAVPATVLPEEQGDRPFTWREVHEMEQSGWVSFGAHTMHHPVLAYLKDAHELEHEVGACRAVLEQQLGHPVYAFAYPIGRFEHIGDEAVKAVQNAGYRWAVTTVNGINTPESDPYRMRRVLGDVTRHWLVMAAEVSGIWGLFSPLWKAVIGKGDTV
jgi:peptidoglycan/xylan/chitin deacetylase (PgdA/CDA1 family)